MKRAPSVFLAILAVAAVVFGVLRYASIRRAHAEEEIVETNLQKVVARQAQDCAEQLQKRSFVDDLALSVRPSVISTRDKYIDLFSKLALAAKNALSTRNYAAARREENALLAQVKLCGMEADTEAEKARFERGEYEGEVLDLTRNYFLKIISLAGPDITSRGFLEKRTSTR